jgi:hypothetical protein
MFSKKLGGHISCGLHRPAVETEINLEYCRGWQVALTDTIDLQTIDLLGERLRV